MGFIFLSFFIDLRLVVLETTLKEIRMYFS